MKNYIIGVLLVGCLFLTSVVYKKSKEPILYKFPVEKALKKSNNPVFYLYVFFSKKNCYNCLRVIDVLNELPEYFVVRGIVPEVELKNEKELREMTGAKFELRKFERKYSRFLPLYSPTIYGVDERGIIYFVLPAVPKEKEYLKKFLMSFYYKTYNLLKSQCKGECRK